MTPAQQRYEDAVKRVAIKLGLPTEVVDKTYKAYWKFVRSSITALPLKEGLSEEEFKKLQTSINIPSLGKIACTWDTYVRIQKRLEYVKKLKEQI